MRGSAQSRRYGVGIKTVPILPGRGGEELNPMKEEFFRRKGEGESPVPDSTLGLGGKRPPDIPPRPSAKAHF